MNRNTVWVTQDGKQYRIKEMASSHIINSIRKIEREKPWREEYLKILQEELHVRNSKLYKVLE